MHGVVHLAVMRTVILALVIFARKRFSCCSLNINLPIKAIYCFEYWKLQEDKKCVYGVGEGWKDVRGC